MSRTSHKTKHSIVRSLSRTDSYKQFCLALFCSFIPLQLIAAENTVAIPETKLVPTTTQVSSKTIQNPKLRLGVPEMLLGMGAALNSGNYEMSFVYIHDGQVDSLRLSHLTEETNQFDMLEHLQGPKRMVVSHNGDTWLYTGNERLLISKEEQSPVIRWRSQLQRLARNISNYKVVVSGLSRIAGRLAYQINFIAKDQSRNSNRLWIDTQYLLPLKLESLNSEKRIIEQLIAVNINYPAALTADNFNPGAGYTQQIDLENEFSKKQLLEKYQGNWSVNWVPIGFELSLRKLKASQKNSYEHWIYSDGLSTLSVFLEPLVNGGKNKKSTFVSGDELIFDLSTADKRITVVGNIPYNVAQKIAQSVTINALKSTPQTK